MGCLVIGRNPLLLPPPLKESPLLAELKGWLPEILFGAWRYGAICTYFLINSALELYAQIRVGQTQVQIQTEFQIELKFRVRFESDLNLWLVFWHMPSCTLSSQDTSCGDNNSWKLFGFQESCSLRISDIYQWSCVIRKPCSIFGITSPCRHCI